MKKFNIKFNDIFFSSWGYEQTNINFFKVIKLTDKTVWFRELNQNKNHNHHYMSGTCTPSNSFKNDKIFSVRMHRAEGDELYNRNDDSLKSYLSRWNGQPCCYSSYA